MEDLLRIADHRCNKMEALMATKLTVSVGNKDSVRELLMKQFQRYTDTSHKIISEKSMASNKKIWTAC